MYLSGHSLFNSDLYANTFRLSPGQLPRLSVSGLAYSGPRS